MGVLKCIILLYAFIFCCENTMLRTAKKAYKLQRNQLSTEIYKNNSNSSKCFS